MAVLAAQTGHRGPTAAGSRNLALPSTRERGNDAIPQAGDAQGAASTPSSLDLTWTLQLVADTIVESLGFEVAVINLVDEETDSMVVAAVAGPDEVRQSLLHRRQGSEGWAQLVAASEPWGRLLFLDHAKSTIDPDDVFSWIPDIPILDDPNAWHPEDSLFAPLESVDGRHLGMLSVDVPRDGLRPGPATRHALEAFAVTASLAIQHAAFAAESRRGAQRFQAVFDASPIAIGLFGSTGYASVNDAFCAFLNRDRVEIVGHQARDFTHPDDLHLTEFSADWDLATCRDDASSPIRRSRSAICSPTDRRSGAGCTSLR